MPATASPTPTAEPTRASTPAPEISSVANFRDVAADGLPLPDGAHMATGVVYRSGELVTASAPDLRRLAKAGIGLVIDLRTDGVAARVPDPAIRGAVNRLVNVYAVYNTVAARPATVAEAREFRRQMNRQFVSVAAQRAKVAEALRLIADAKAPVLIHCTEGKDRTGWISALLQLIAGADRDQAVAEYLKSNEYRAEIIKSNYEAMLASRGLEAARVRRALDVLRADYLEAGLAEMDRRYGGLDGYLTDGLGLSKATIAALREKLTA